MEEEKYLLTTIDDVAERAQVSISTVSRVLNGRDRVHPDTRERVMAAARELNYQPSAFARGLATQRTQTLGFVIPTISDPFFLEIVRGVEEVARANRYVLLVVSEPYSTHDHSYLRLFTQRRVDGLILVGIDLDRAEITRLLKHGFPLVLVQHSGAENVPTIVVDNYSGASAAAQHLLQHGCRRLAYISGSDHTPDNAERLQGLRDTLAAHGLDLPEHYVTPGDYLAGSGYNAMLRLLEQAEKPDAVFAANDQMAADALLAIRDRGLRVPEDIALVGFDDLPLATYVSPPLTTVHQPAHEMGRLAAHTALDQLAGRSSMARVVLPTNLVVRRSCGCT